ncbi:MAG: hypothetical protein J7L58_03905 [Thermoplasmata archaeon]|nr:hypothetical protein [Thermoplasmata archaeon]
MGKTSTVTFISIVASIIAFSIFISAFPEGIKISSPLDIKYEGRDFKFYGGIEGEGSKLYSINSSAILNNMSIEGKILVNGSFVFVSYSALFVAEKIFTKEIEIHGKNCWVTTDNNSTFYESIDGKIKGEILIEIEGEIKLMEGMENKSIEVVPESFIKIFPAKFNKIFFINGSGKIEIEGEEKNFSKYVFFRGEGKYNKNRLNASGYLLAIDGKFYDDEKKIYFIPLKIFALWVVAIALFIISSFLKKNIFIEKDEMFAGFSAIMWLLFFGISIYLWSCEMERIFGLSLMDVKKITIGSLLFLSLFIVPYLVAVGIIGFPAKVAVAAIFEMIGLSNVGKGIGRAIGFSLTTFWGISLISSLLNLTLSPLLRLLG